jgi:hypothetical protein
MDDRLGTHHASLSLSVRWALMVGLFPFAISQMPALSP